MLKESIFNFLARNRRNIVMKKFDRLVFALHKGYENLSYDFDRNGERFVIERLGRHGGIKTVLDVGANAGEWSAMAAGAFPGATIHSFEIVPATFDKLVKRCAPLTSVIPHNVGLSDAEGTTDIYFSKDNSGLATCVKGFAESFHGFRPDVVQGKLTTGDAFCGQNGIDTVDLLKIDVEGFEPRVLKGFGRMLGNGKVRAIQFEYGYMNASVKFLLKDFYELLGGYGMKIGKIYPNYVDFREYRCQDENFFGPNYLAVHGSLAPLMELLGG